MQRNRIISLTSLTCLLALFASGCSGLTKIDFTHPSRAGWQRPDRVLEALELSPGDRVADLGSGHGFFLPYLSEAVGEDGLVYALEVEAELVAGLKTRADDDELGNVEVILAGYDDSRLPDASVDVILIVNTYHHIENRQHYFRALKHKLRPHGRIAIIEPNEDLAGLLSLVVADGHASRAADIRVEMLAAGYKSSKSVDTLPIQVFEIWTDPTNVAGN